MEKKPTWVCTSVIQLCLCFALYGALNLGQPQKSIYQKSHDFYFISVSGGFRPFEQQTHLLKLMERVAKFYEARFVVNTSELGEDDPLRQNATMLFPSLKVPWYTTRASKGEEFGCFQEKIKLPHGITLDIIGVDTSSLQETMLAGLSSGTAKNQINWLTRTLQSINSNWCIVVGFHPLILCEGNKEQTGAKRIYNNSLHHIFMKFGVNLYLSKHGGSRYSRHDSVTYIENPDLIESANGTETVDGFLLHRVSSLEIATYFVTLAGEVVHRTVIQQRGKEVM